MKISIITIIIIIVIIIITAKTTIATNNTKKANQQGLFETFAYDYIWSGACNPMRLGLRKQSG